MSKDFSYLYMPYNHLNSCEVDDINMLETLSLIKKLAYKNYPISLTDVLSNSSYYQAIAYKITKENKDNTRKTPYSDENKFLFEAVEKILDLEATEEDLQKVQNFYVWQAIIYIEYNNISVSYVSKITDSTIAAFENNIPEEDLHKFSSHEQLLAYVKARDAGESEETLKIIEDFGFWQAQAYIRYPDISISYASKVTDSTKTFAFGYNIPEEILHKFHSDKEVKAYAKARDAGESEETLKIIEDFGYWQADAYISYPNISISYASKVNDRASDAFEYKIPEEILHKFHSNEQVRAYAKARDMGESEETLKIIEDFEYWQADAYISYSNISISYASKLNFGTRYAFKYNIPEEILHKFHSYNEIKAYTKARDAGESEESLKKVEDFDFWQAEAYIRYPNIPIDYAGKVNNEASDAFEYKIPEEIVHKFYSSTQVIAYAKARDAGESEETLKTIEDFNLWQADAYLSGYDINCAKKINHYHVSQEIKEICVEDSIYSHFHKSYNDMVDGIAWWWSNLW